MSSSYTPEAVTARLRDLSATADLRAERRLATKIDMSAAAVTRRLRAASELRDACLAWGRWFGRTGAGMVR